MEWKLHLMILDLNPRMQFEGREETLQRLWTLDLNPSISFEDVKGEDIDEVRKKEEEEKAEGKLSFGVYRILTSRLLSRR